uniref:J domain-containing protein n=1 Tax=Manihot esculenta TaxID=3983 RepID=A0A2C9UU69_MANES
MEASVEEALRAKEMAEKRFAEKDFAGAKNYALKAKTLCPGLEGISQMVATFEVYIASEVNCNGEIDLYSVLGLKPSADRNAVKKQYKKMAVLLHPDKNKTVGADGAFKLVSEAWTVLSDNLKRSSYDLKRTKLMASSVAQTNFSSVHTAGVTGYNKFSNSSSTHGLDTFWTVCTSCKVQYEYLRKYVNKRLSCKNCRGTFIAVETGTGPVNGSFPYCPWSCVPGSGYGSHGYDGVTYVPNTATVFAGNGVSGLHSGHGYEYVSNVSFQWSSLSGTSAGVVGHNVSSAVSTDAVYQVNGNGTGARANLRSAANGKHSIKTSISNMNSNVPASYNEYSGAKAGRPDKRRKVVVGANLRNEYEEKGSNSAPQAGLANGYASVEQGPKLSNPNELPARRISIAPAFDARKLLIDKARTDIRKKLEEIRSVAAAAAVALKEKAQDQSREAAVAPKCDNSDVSGHQTKPIKTGPMSITVPDPDFHDFDKDRSEECFKPKQIWALYDEDDGMPRLYCLIRQVVSVKPFKILITYLNSKTDSEFGQVNWIYSGFTKSCGHFRAWNTDIVDQVNVFSHLLKGEKAGRGGCVRIYPKSGDIWAIYRNWSPDWNRATPDHLRHQYEMVEVLDDYSEELGVCVTPLIKLEGFKTVYLRNTNKDAIRWIPRREMLRFSHQVPSWSLEGEGRNLPGKCWDLDPAATPDELLHAAEAKA